MLVPKPQIGLKFSSLTPYFSPKISSLSPYFSCLTVFKAPICAPSGSTPKWKLSTPTPGPTPIVHIPILPNTYICTKIPLGLWNCDWAKFKGLWVRSELKSWSFKRYYTSNQTLACFVLHLKIINTFTENIKVSQYAKLSHLTHFLSVRWHTGTKVTHFSPRCVISLTKNESNDSVLRTDSLPCFLCYWKNMCILLVNCPRNSKLALKFK